ncbi:MAG: anaerobic sulfatase maturase [Armatimonadota bacterium]
MKPFTLLIKPTSADCNLQCDYCFYLDRCGLYPETSIHRMTDSTLERLISSYMATDQPQYAFSWQGGEPTLMGVDFFRRVVSLQKQYGRSGVIVANSLQTNGTLINDEFAELLYEYNFLLGVSLDGPADIHNYFRKNAAGYGSHASVMNGIDCLKRNKVEFNILSLISSANVSQGRDLYRYLCDLGIMYHQYIPCVEFDSAGNPLPWTISADQWGDFLCSIYDEWILHDTRKISVRLFDSILLMLVEGYCNLCQFDSNCCQYLVIEHNGDVYPCDFFVNADLKLGNIETHSWDRILASELYASFGKQKAQLCDECKGCEYVSFCAGDCLKHRLGACGKIERKSHLCDGWKRFFKHALPGFARLANEIISDRKRIGFSNSNEQNPEISGIGRNDPCPCGSGKKYKRCHGQ